MSNNRDAEIVTRSGLPDEIQKMLGDNECIWTRTIKARKFGCDTNENQNATRYTGSYKFRDIVHVIARLEHRVSLLEQNTMKFREEVIESE